MRNMLWLGAGPRRTSEGRGSEERERKRGANIKLLTYLTLLCYVYVCSTVYNKIGVVFYIIVHVYIYNVCMCVCVYVCMLLCMHLVQDW